MIWIKLLLISTLLFILFQDVKERQVYWFLFPIVGLTSGVLFFTKTIPELFFMAVITNLILVCFLFTIIALYIKYKLKIKFKDAIGLGDLLLFVALTFTFSTFSFIYILVFSLIGALLLHLFLTRNKNNDTVPLAGYVSLFFVLFYFGFWANLTPSLYGL